MKKRRLFVRWKFWISVLLCMVLLLAWVPASPVSAEDGGIVPDGVYLMENVSVIDNHSVYGNFYLEASSADAGATFSVRTDEIGDLENNIYRYWYFEHLGNNEYVIRSMAKKSMVLTVNETGDGVTLSEEGASLTSASTWVISGRVGSCVIKNSLYPTKSLTCPPNNVTYSINYYYYLPVQVLTYQAMTIDYWKLTACTDLKSKGIDDNTEYLIMNYVTDRYMSLSQASTANGTTINTAADSTSSMTRWKPIAQKDLTYQLINMYSGSKVLSASGTSLSLNTDTNAAGQMFEIERIDSGIYQGLYYIRCGNYYVTANSIDSGNAYLSSTSTRFSVWSFKKVAKGTAHLYNFQYQYTGYPAEDDCVGETKTYSTIGNQQLFLDTFDSFGYTENYFRNSDTATAMNSLKNSDIFVYRGHAGPGRLAFKTTEHTLTGRIYAHESDMINDGNDNDSISSLEDNALSSMRCILLLGCQTGVTDSHGHNLVDALYEKGAHFVLGTTEKMDSASNGKFLERFLTAFESDNDIAFAYGEAMKYDDYVYHVGEVEYIDYFPDYAKGDQTQTLE